MNETKGHWDKRFRAYNAITTGADALADPGVMPQLGELWMTNDTIPKSSAANIGREGLYAVL